MAIGFYVHLRPAMSSSARLHSHICELYLQVLLCRRAHTQSLPDATASAIPAAAKSSQRR